MIKQQRGLGRGLDALLASGPDKGHQIGLKDGALLPIKMIKPNPFQPRVVFQEDAIKELAQSIRQYGVLQPVVVRRTLDGYELVSGERRWRAAQLAGLKEMPALVREYTDGDMTEIALIENIQREDLNPIEEAAGYRRLMDEFGFTQEEVARKIGRSRSLIANMVRLLNLTSVVQDYVSRGTLTVGQVRPLLALEDTELQVEAADLILAEDLSARDAEELVRRLQAKQRQPKQETEKTVENPLPDLFMLETQDRLKMLLGTQVRIKAGKLKSRIEIEFRSAEDLERILAAMNPVTGRNDYRPALPERLPV